MKQIKLKWLLIPALGIWLLVAIRGVSLFRSIANSQTADSESVPKTEPQSISLLLWNEFPFSQQTKIQDQPKQIMETIPKLPKPKVESRFDDDQERPSILGKIRCAHRNILIQQDISEEWSYDETDKEAFETQRIHATLDHIGNTDH